MIKGTTKRASWTAFVLFALGCAGRAENQGSAGVGGSDASGVPNISGAGGLVNGIVYPDNAAGLGGTGGGLIGAGGDEAASPNVVLACAPDNLSLLLLCTTPLVIGTACEPTAFVDCRQGGEFVLCGPLGSCVPPLDGGGYYD